MQSKIFNKVELEKIAVKKNQYPEPDLMEVAIVGRSNVGKSSFINLITGRRSIARVSGQPGKTRTINFYNIDNDFRLVDLPGYGYAKASTKDKNEWKKFIEEYLINRENLSLVISLIDIRHNPTSDDIMMNNFLDEMNIKKIIVATKADKISKNKIQISIKNIKNIIKSETEYFYSSSLNRIGRDEIINYIYNIINKKEV